MTTDDREGIRMVSIVHSFTLGNGLRVSVHATGDAGAGGDA